MKPKLLASEMSEIRAKSDKILKDLEEWIYDMSDEVAFRLIPEAFGPDGEVTDELVDLHAEHSETVAGVVMQMILTRIQREF